MFADCSHFLFYPAKAGPAGGRGDLPRSRRVTSTYAGEGEVVGIASGKVEVLALELELAILDGDEGALGSASAALGGGNGAGRSETEGQEGGGLEMHVGCFWAVGGKTSKSFLG